MREREIERDPSIHFNSDPGIACGRVFEVPTNGDTATRDYSRVTCPACRETSRFKYLLGQHKKAAARAAKRARS